MLIPLKNITGVNLSHRFVVTRSHIYLILLFSGSL
jgi:hypothetical protein